MQPSSFMKANIQIITNCSYRIDEIIQLQVGNERYSVYVNEFDPVRLINTVAVIQI